MNKKRYLIIIAIIIFGFLALFTFANPNENGEPNNNRVLEEIEEDDIINNNQNVNEDGEKEEEKTPVYNDHGVNIDTILRVEDNSYELALNAVIRAEVSLENDKYDIALDLVSKVTDEDKKEELEERLEIVLDTMELIELVKELVEMTSSAKNLNELDAARDYQVSNEIIDRITKLVNNTLKESLNDEVDTVLYLLKDKAAPTINIEDEAILKDVVVLDVKDDNKFTMTLTKEGEESKNVKNGDEVSDGVYTLTVIDESFNEKTITFTVDTVAPEGEIKYSTTEIINGEVVATLVPSETVTVTNNNGSLEYKFEENGSFTFEFVDRAGNKGTKTATVENIDTKKPGVSIGGTTGENYWFQEQTFSTVITEENIDSVYYIWNQSSNDNSMKRDLDSAKATKVDVSTLTNNGDGTYTLSVTLNTEGRYVFNVKVVDKAGNVEYKRKGWYQIDRTAPTGEIEYSTTEIINGKVVATLVPSETVTVTNNNGSLEYKFEENGSFTFEFVDRAGNKGTKTAKVENIDTKKPEISIGGTTGSKYWYQEQTFSTVITEENIDSVYYIWNQSSNDNSMKRDLDSAKATKVDVSTLTNNGDGTYTLSVTLNTEGRYVFNVKVVDKAGNVEYKRKGWYQIDRTAPKIVFDSNPIYVEKNSKVDAISLTAKVTDNIDADKTIEPTKIDFISVRNNDALNKLDIDKLDSSKEGTFKVYYETTDNVGNKATAMLEVVVRDTREFKLLSQTVNTQDNYKTMIAVIVTNKEIKEAPAGWSFSLNNPTVITKKYTYNTDTTGEDVKLYDLSGNELVVNVVITDVKEFAKQNVVLRDHTTLEETINIASGEEKVIDLNGKTLTVDNTNVGTNARLFQNKGKLTIKNGKIIQPLDTTLGVVDNDGGEFILENVTIEDKGSRNASSIRNLNGGKVTIINSIIKADGIAGYVTSGSTKDYVYSNAAVYSSGELVIKNSTIEGNPESQYAIFVVGGTALVEDTTIDHLRGGFGITAGNVTINNVTVIMPAGGRSSSHAIYMEAQADTNVTINGGSFVGTRSSLYIINASTTNNLTLNINGGDFDSYLYKDEYKVVNFVKGASTPENKFNINIKGGKFAQTTINDKVVNTTIDDKYIVDGYKQVGADIIPE